MSKIRILHINVHSRIAGSETWFLNFVKGIQGSDVEPVLLCPKGPFADAAHAQGVRVMLHRFRFFDLSTHSLWKYPLFLIFRMWDSFVIGRIAKRNDVKLIHSVDVNGHIIGSFIKSFYSTKVLWRINGEHKRTLYRFFKPDFIVFNALLRQKILNNLPLKSAQKHSVIYNGIDASIYEEKNSPDDRPVRIGFVGRLQPAKGIETFLDAVPLIHQKYGDVLFTVYGEEIYDEVLKGQYAAFLKQKIRDLGVDSMVQMRGFVFSQVEIFALINIFVMPSERISESGPNVILESWAAGVPVIATNVGGIPELITHNETGFLIPPKDPQAIADAVEYVIENPDAVRKVVDNARRLVREKFDYRENARKFVELYRELLNEKD